MTHLVTSSGKFEWNLLNFHTLACFFIALAGGNFTYLFQIHTSDRKQDKRTKVTKKNIIFLFFWKLLFFCLTGHMVVVGVVLVVALGCMYIHKYGILLRYWRCGIASILTVAPICFLREVTWLVWPFWENDEQKKPFFPKKCCVTFAALVNTWTWVCCGRACYKDFFGIFKVLVLILRRWSMRDFPAVWISCCKWKNFV